MRDRLEDLARLEARNGGKPIAAARGEIGLVAAVFEYWGGAANKITGETIPIQQPGIDLTLREPVGVCALITPWNFPAVIASWKIAPALACGNTAVVKPASQTPLTALALGEILAEAGLPEGTLSVLPGPGLDDGSALVADPRVSKIIFTGSTEVGTQRDADGRDEHHAGLARAGRQVGQRRVRRRRPRRGLEPSLWSVFDNAGQDCCARSRAFVQRPVYDEFVAADRGAAPTRSRSAQPLEESTQMGPMISEGQRRTALDYLEVGLDGGRAPGDRAARCPDGRPRLLPAAGRARRRRQRMAGRAGGDLRSGRCA